MITAVLPTYNRAPMAFVRGAGSWLTAEDGTRYLDLGAGIAVNALGHANPDLVAALSEQAGKLWHVSNLYRIPEQERLAEALVGATFADTVFFTNSGTEAAELALKMARKYHYDKHHCDKHHCDKGAPREQIIAFEGAFHGRSTGAIAAAGAEKMVKGFGALMPGFTHLKWGDHEALRAAITDQTCAVIIEPIQGEGGIRVVPDQCLKGLRDLCDRSGTLLIFDEVQCGMGRTGRLFAHEWAGITPDIMMVAKGLGGGFPLGAVLATADAARGMGTGTHGSTYGGNPLACAVGSRVLDLITAAGFLDAVGAKGARFAQGLQGLVAAHPAVFEGVRGVGLMLGLKCKALNSDIVKAAYGEHLLTIPAADNVIRLLPALNITDADLTEALARLDRAAVAVERSL